MSQKNKPFRIGIIGGMGPQTDVLLQKLIIEATPAKKDQDYFQVLCFSNPKIPDRTQSLEQDDGRRYVAAIRKTARALIGSSVNVLAIPCNTAHARLARIQQGLHVPIIDMVSVTARTLRTRYPTVQRVGILATDGTLRTQLYEHALAEVGITQCAPHIEDQKKIMGSIYRIKAGERVPAITILPIIERLLKNNAEVVITGCTELSLLYPDLKMITSAPIIDPLRILAEHLVAAGLKNLSGAPRETRRA